MLVFIAYITAILLTESDILVDLCWMNFVSQTTSLSTPEVYCWIQDSGILDQVMFIFYVKLDRSPLLSSF